MPLGKIYFLIPSTCKYVTFYGQRNFVCVIELRVLREEIVLDRASGPM